MKPNPFRKTLSAPLKNKEYPEVLDSKHQVSAQEVKTLMWGYLSRHKNFSQRKLAAMAVKDMKDAGLKISLESVQRIFGKDAKKAPMALKQILVKYLLDSGFASEQEIFTFAKENIAATQDEFSLISSEDVNQLALAWLYINPTESKRVLSKILKEKLAALGYEYNLGSLQNILSYKVAQTKKVVFIALKKLLIDTKFGTEEALEEFLKTTPKLEERPVVKRERRRVPKRNLKKIFDMWQEATDDVQKEDLKSAFFSARLSEIQRIWLKRRKKAERKLRRRAKPLHIPSYLYAR